MKVSVKKACVRLGFFLFALSLIALILNEKIAIGLLTASFGTFISGGFVNRLKKNKREKV